MENFNMRIGKIEGRTCDKHLLTDGENETIEIVEWFDNNKYCSTVAFFKKGKENYNLEFVGRRPFDVDLGIFFKIAETCQDFLDGQSEIED